MRESKRKKLEAKGWRIGTPKDFLGMSCEEEAYVNLRQKLAEGLKARRRDRGITQVGLAQAIKSSQSRVAKREAGDPTVSLDLLVKSLLALGTTNANKCYLATKSSLCANRPSFWRIGSAHG